MTKVEMEKPVVSKELAETFEELRNNFPSISCNAGNYSGSIPEIENLSVSKFEELLTRMYVLGYEIEKPKLKHIILNTNKTKLYKNDDDNYLALIISSNKYQLSPKHSSFDAKTVFTQSEVEEFLKDEPKGMWVVEDVVSDND